MGHVRHVAERMNDIDVAVDADEGQAQHGHDDEAVVEEACDVAEKAAEDPAVEPEWNQRGGHDETSATQVSDGQVNDEHTRHLISQKEKTKNNIFPPLVISQVVAYMTLFNQPHEECNTCTLNKHIQFPLSVVPYTPSEIPLWIRFTFPLPAQL